MRLAKIVATLGPATQEPEMIQNLILAGVNVFRLNFSHGQHDNLTNVVRNIRRISQELDFPVAILADLQGPKFRIGELEDHRPVFLEKDSELRFTAGKTPGSASHLTTNTPQIIEELRVGDEVLMDDGSLALEVIERVTPHEVRCKVRIGGLLGEKKGINVPGLKMPSLAAMTEKDEIDALFALQQDVDFMALSFVRSYSDVLYLRRFLEQNIPYGQRIPLIIAKIEKPQALDEIDAIIQTADGIMVARGDLGVELGPERVPAVQKMLIAKANAAEKPVITATQMLETMTHSATPTRAEVSDVANAVFDGSDALMLSGETAMGKYPIETVRMMARIIRESEAQFHQWHQTLMPEELKGDAHRMKFHQAIAQAACFAATQAHAKAIVVLSYSGNMAKRISKRKPMLPIIALTPHQKIYRMMSLLGGVYPLKINASETTDGTFKEAETAITRKNLLQLKDPIVFCAGQTHIAGMTNSIKLYHFGELLVPDQPLPAQAEQALPAPQASQTADSATASSVAERV